MSEYIDREVALKIVIDMMCDCKVTHKGRAIRRNIKQIPIADVVEVKHGEWITPTKIKSMNIAVPHCSLCGNVPCDKAFYCPYCGAKMDLKEGAEK